MDDELVKLRDENEALREALARMAAICMPEELKEGAPLGYIPPLDLGMCGNIPYCGTPFKPKSTGGVDGVGGVEDVGEAAAGTSGDASSSPSQRGSVAPLRGGSGRPDGQEVELSSSAKEVDRSYFDSYGGFGIHQDMISDKPRTESYQQALESNPSLVRGKVVLDVGCGTGILSLFASRAGAAKVISVEGNERMAGFARQVRGMGSGCGQKGERWVEFTSLNKREEWPHFTLRFCISYSRFVRQTDLAPRLGGP